MSYVTIIWSMVASACLTLAAMHLLVWCMQRRAWANLLFSLTAVATAGMGYCELLMMCAQTPGQFGTALRWVHVPAFALIVGLVGFVLVHLRAGRRWLAWAACTVRALSLLLDFLIDPNVNYREITGLRHISFLGDSISVCVGVPSAWNLVGHLSLVLLVIFVADAGITVWRRGDRRQAVVVAGSIVFFVLAATVQTMLARWEVFHWPETTVVFFMGIVLAMTYEMSREAIRAGQLSVDLRESEERMTMAAAAASVGVWVWNIARNQVWGSEFWLHLFAFAPDATVTFDEIMQRIHPDDREVVGREVRQAMEQGQEYAADFRLVLPDGSQRWIAARGRVQSDVSGKPARMLGVAIDITERRRAELEIVQQRQDLAHLSRVTMLGELSGALAHELNQPLTAILSNAEAAQMFFDSGTPDLGEIRKILDDIVAADKRAGEIILRLRSMLKKEEMTRQPLDINEALQDVLKLVRSELVSHGVTVETLLADGLPLVGGDRVQFQQVLINLIMNASDAMAGNVIGDRKLVLRTEFDGGTVSISVSDYGTGIPVDILDKVFNSFVTTKAAGLGMGLSVCRTIIAAHRGSITAENNPDRGACFRVILPVTSAEAH